MDNHLAKELSKKSIRTVAEELGRTGVGIKKGVTEQERIQLSILLKEYPHINSNNIGEMEDAWDGMNLIVFYTGDKEDEAEKLLQRTLDKLKKDDKERDRDQQSRQVGVTRFDYEGMHYIEIITEKGLRFLPYKSGEFYEPIANLTIPDAEEEDKAWEILPLPQIGSSKATELLKKSDI